MSQSKSAGGAKAKTTKAKQSSSARKKTAALAAGEEVSVRVIPAPSPAASSIELTAAEKARSKRVLELTADIEKALNAGEREVVLDPAAVQALMAAACKVYAQHIELGERYDTFESSTVTPTAVMVTASGLLKAANLAVFELGMWQSWTGR